MVPTIRIAYLLPNIEPGGTEKHVLALARSLDRTRYSLSLATTAGGGSLLKEFSEIMPVTVMGEPDPRRRIKTGPLFHLGTVRSLARIYRRERPDIVHAYLPAACVIGPLAARLAGSGKVIVSRRALSNYKAKYPLLHHVEPLGYLLADVVLVNSEAVRRDVEQTERFWEGKIRLIYNGIAANAGDVPPIGELVPEISGEPAGPVVVYVANLFSYKGHMDLVDAARIVGDEFPSARFLLVGRDAGAMESIRSRIAALGLERRVLFTGMRHDAARIAAASTFVVHPSHEEGFSNTILEGMAAGKAVVATRVGGNPEAVVEGDTGLLVPPRDPKELAEAILALLRNPVWARSMGEAGKRRAAERFSLDAMVRQFEALYESLVPGAARPGEMKG